MSRRAKEKWFFRGGRPPVNGIVLGLAIFLTGHLLTFLILWSASMVYDPLVLFLKNPGVMQLTWEVPLVLSGKLPPLCVQTVLVLAGQTLLIDGNCFYEIQNAMKPPI